MCGKLQYLDKPDSLHSGAHTSVPILAGCVCVSALLAQLNKQVNRRDLTF